MDAQTSSLTSSLSERYILTRVGKQELAFPSQWVAQIVTIERSRVLNLPFYAPVLLGVVHHQGNIIPLILSQLLFAEKLDRFLESRILKETLMFVRLGQITKELSGVGLVVDRLVGSISKEQIVASGAKIFQPQDLPNQVWQPQRWLPNSLTVN